LKFQIIPSILTVKKKNICRHNWLEIVGFIERVIGKAKLPEPEGWNPEKDQFNLPFAIELKEDWHIHWADIRIEMTSDDFDGFAQAVIQAYDRWKKDGKPETLPEMKRYGEFPGEEGFDHFKPEERNQAISKNGKTRFHFRKFPRTDSGKLFFDPIFQVELQKARDDAPNGWYHLHYKNFRIEIGEKQLKDMTDAMTDLQKG
jgi:hypothetical protein